MHAFFAHPKTKPGPCGLRCCGNKFANRIPRSCNRKGHTVQRMRRYIRHVERQATRCEVAQQLTEQEQDRIEARIRHLNLLAQMEYADSMIPHLEELFPFRGTCIHDERMVDR
jgi:hypothetical protein